ncbi:MAG: tetratricopeptide repeat protein [Pseudomonadota bacterium]
MDAYRTEEEQVEALKRWWDENGKSTVAAIIIAVSGAVVWQTWQGQQETSQMAASDSYQALVNSLSRAQQSGDNAEVVKIASELKESFDSSTYAQFAAMHLARIKVEEGDLAGAEAELRWVLGEAGRGSDVARITELRLARLVAAQGDADQALGILAAGEQGTYAASYTLARGDILYAAGREDEARAAYTQARLLAAQGGQAGGLASLEQKLASLSPVPAREIPAMMPVDELVETVDISQSSEAEE